MRALAVAAVAALVLSACQDPAGVGLGLIDEEQVDPTAQTVALTDFVLFNDSTVAIGLAQAGDALAQGRVLAGAVADPLYGDLDVVGYVDFLRGTVPSGAAASDVSEVWLELVRSYAYGDTTTALPLELRQITEDWEADRDYAPDRRLEMGPVLSTTTVTAADSLTRFDLPTAWVRQNAALLIGDDFADGFEGFALQTPAAFTPAPGVAWGFETYASRGSRLRFVVDEDTLSFSLSEVFSSIASEAPTAPSAEAFAARSSSQAALAFEADLEAVGTTALAQARLRLPLLTSVERDGAFLRPLSSRAFLFGVRGTETDRVRTFLGELRLADGELAVSSPLALTDSVQAVLLGSRPGFDRFEIVPDPSQASLSILPIRRPAATATDPRLTLTIVGGAPSQ